MQFQILTRRSFYFSYQILKDPRQCANKHKYCYTCIFVWSTSGPHTNHGRCPVCRTDGHYVRNRELEEKIGRLKVKCHLKSCNWKGPLRFLGKHTHTTYTRTGLPYRSRFDEHYRSAYSHRDNDELPPLERDSRGQQSESGARLSLRPPSNTNRISSRPSASGASTARELYNATTSRESTSDLRQSVATTQNTPRTPRPPTTPASDGSDNPTNTDVTEHSEPECDAESTASGCDRRNATDDKQPSCRKRQRYGKPVLKCARATSRQQAKTGFTDDDVQHGARSWTAGNLGISRRTRTQTTRTVGRG